MSPLVPGTLVARGPDWKWGDQDKSGSFGTVVDDVSGLDDAWVAVQWPHVGVTYTYRWGFEGKFDLRVISEDEKEQMMLARGTATPDSAMSRAKNLIEGRIAMSKRTSTTHPDLLTREIAKARVDSYRLALLDLESAAKDPIR